MKLKLAEKSVAAITLPEGVAQVVVWDTELIGFGVVIGRQNRTFIAEGRVDGRKRRKAIGVAGRVRADGLPWTAQLARIEAKKILGDVVRGIDPNSGRHVRREGPTLREAIDLHLSKMRRNDSRPRSIELLEYEAGKHLKDWMDSPLATITRTNVRERHERLT